MTDSTLQFNYSDNVHLVSIYIRSDTHKEKFIPLLCDIIKSCNYNSRNRSWNYTVAEIISKITEKYDGGVKFIPENQKSTVIYNHTISIIESYYIDKNNDLLDFVTISSKYCNSKKSIFKGKINDFKLNIFEENNKYLIEELEKEIKENKRELTKLKKLNHEKTKKR